MTINRRRFNWAIAQVAHAFQVEQEDMVGETRRQPVARARQVAMAVLRKRWNLSFPVIGSLFDRDHTTVVHAVQVVGDDPLVERLSAYADAAGLDPALPSPTHRFPTGSAQVFHRPEFDHFSKRFVGLR